MKGKLAALTLTTAILGVTVVSFTACGDGDDSVSSNRSTSTDNIQVGPRPYYLVEDMDEGTLKNELQECAEKTNTRSDFSIGHRGASMQFPEHTRESYLAAIRMGAGIVECDVTFTKDMELVCRHSQCDLQNTTNILATDLASKCSEPFTPADPITGTPAHATCCTSDITLAEFKTLKGKMDGSNSAATTVEEYMAGTPGWRTDMYASNGTLMTHAESIELFKSHGVKMTPEIKTPSVSMPYQGTYTQEMFAQQVVNEYKNAGVSADQVFVQSFLFDDMKYLIANEPEFGAQAVLLDDESYGEAAEEGYPENYSEGLGYDFAISKLPEYAAAGVKYIAPAMPFLVGVDSNGNLVPSEYAKVAKANGLKIITWTLERSGTLTDGGGWYYHGDDYEAYGYPGGSQRDDEIGANTAIISHPGDTYKMLDVLAQDVGVVGVFSDWPATVTYYANCKGL